MNDTWKIYAMDDCDYWLARSKEEAIESMKDEYGYTDEDMPDTSPIELAKEDMESLLTFEEDTPEDKHTFREALDRRIKQGIKFPECFASTNV